MWNRLIVRGALAFAFALAATSVVHADKGGTTPASGAGGASTATTPPTGGGGATTGTPSGDGTTVTATPTGNLPAGSTASSTTSNPTGAPAGEGTATDATAAPPNLRLRRLEQRVQALKEQAWRVKARVGMLKEAVLGQGIGATASIVHENKMSGTFRLIRLVYALDGAEIFAREDDTGKLNDTKNIEILSGPIAPGNHTISVLIVYQGHGYGVFDYLNKYKFTVHSSHTFTVAEGKQTQITVVGYERGGITTKLEKKPAVDFKVNVASSRPSAAGK